MMMPGKPVLLVSCHFWVSHCSVILPGIESAVEIWEELWVAQCPKSTFAVNRHNSREVSLMSTLHLNKTLDCTWDNASLYMHAQMA